MGRGGGQEETVTAVLMPPACAAALGALSCQPAHRKPKQHGAGQQNQRATAADLTCCQKPAATTCPACCISCFSIPLLLLLPCALPYTPPPHTQQQSYLSCLLHELLELRVQLLLLLPCAPVLPHSLYLHAGGVTVGQLLPVLIQLPLKGLYLLQRVQTNTQSACLDMRAASLLDSCFMCWSN